MVGKINSVCDKTYFSDFLKVSILYSWIAITIKAIIDPVYFKFQEVLEVMRGKSFFTSRKNNYVVT